MAANITVMKSVPRVNVVQALEEALVKAKAGNLVNVVIAGWRDDDFLESWIAGWHRDNMSAADALHQKTLQGFLGG